MELTIDPGFKKHLPPLDETAYNELEESIVSHGGARDPLVVWSPHNILIEGHNRYEICKKHGLPFSVVEKEFKSALDAYIWMDSNQIGRRNLNPAQRAEAIARLVKNCEGEKGVAEKVAERVGVSKRTVHRAVSRMDALESLPTDIREKVQSGELKASLGEVATLSKLPESQQRKVVKSVEDGEFESVKECLNGVGNEVSDDPIDGPPTRPTNKNPTKIHKELVDMLGKLARKFDELQEIAPRGSQRQGDYHEGRISLARMENVLNRWEDELP